MIEGLNISIPQRLAFIKITLVIGLILSVLLSVNLWTGNHDFPVVPVFLDFAIPCFIQVILVILLLLLWLSSLFLKYHRLIILISVFLALFMVFLDVNRLQPWFYIYECMLIVFIFYNGRVDDSNRYTSFLIILQLIFASVYFFNGISCLNPYFTETSFTSIIYPIKHFISDRQFLFVVKAGNYIPFVLIFIGLGLTISVVRYLAIGAAIIFHLLLFLLLFPSSGHPNYALWLMNLIFLILLLLLFSGKTKQKYFSPTFLLQRFIFYPVLVFLLLMPLLNRFGYWPDYLSSNFNSGNNISMKLSLSESAFLKLPPKIKACCYRDNFNYTLDQRAWSENELNASYFPHKLVFLAMQDYIIAKAGLGSEEINLVALPHHKLLFKR